MIALIVGLALDYGSGAKWALVKSGSVDIASGFGLGLVLGLRRG